MVSIVHSQIQAAQYRRKKDSHLNACLFQGFPPAVRHETASHSIGQNSHLHSLSCLPDQDGRNGIKHLIIFDDVILHVNVFLCLLQFTAQILELILPVRKNLHLIIHGENTS